MEKIIIPVWSKKDDGGCEKNMRSKGWHDKENEECDRELLTELSFKLVCTNILGWCCRTSPMMPRWLQTWACGVYACVQARNRKARSTQLKMFQGQVKSCFEICPVVNPKIDSSPARMTTSLLEKWRRIASGAQKTSPWHQTHWTAPSRSPTNVTAASLEDTAIADVLHRILTASASYSEDPCGKDETQPRWSVRRHSEPRAPNKRGSQEATMTNWKVLLEQLVWKMEPESNANRS